MADAPASARILERGYRRFAGERRGTAAAVGTLAAHTTQRLLGLRRPARHKVLPVVVAALSYLPAIVFVGAAALLPAELSQAVLPDHADFTGTITTAILLFVVLVAPEALCPDRRHGTIALYLASPLDRTTYLAAKVAAVGGVLLVVTLGPSLLVQLGYLLLGVVEVGWALGADLVRIAAAGLVLALAYGAAGLAAASLTDRRALASAGLLGALLLASVATSVSVALLDAPSWVGAADLSRLPAELVQRIHGATGGLPELTTATVVGATAAWTAGLAAVVWVRYRRLVVAR